MNLFSEIFGNYWKILEKYCRGVRWRISLDRFLNGEFFSEIFSYYWKILSGCGMPNLFRQVLKGWIIYGNFRKLLENIVGKQDDETLQTDVLKEWIYFQKFSDIIGKYCRGVGWRISSDRFLKGEFFSEIFGNYWKILSRCETTNLFRQMFLKSEFIFGYYGKLLENIVGVRDEKSL